MPSEEPGGAPYGETAVAAGRSGGRHAAPRRTLLERMHMPVGKVVALAAMPSAALLGMGFTSPLAKADQNPDNPFQPGPCVEMPEGPGEEAKPDTGDGGGEPSPAESTGEQPPARPTPSREDRPRTSPEPRPGPSASAEPPPGETTPAEAASGQAAPEPAASPEATEPSPASGEENGTGGEAGGLFGLGESLRELGEGLEDLFGGDGDGDGGRTGQPGEPEETAGAPDGAPSPSAGETPAGEPADGPSAAPGPGGSPGAVPGAAPGEPSAPAASHGPAAAEPSPSPGATADAGAPDEDGKLPFPCPEEKQVPGTGEQTRVTLPDDPWYLEATSLTLRGLVYHGVVNVTTADGTVKQTLKFTADKVDIGDLHQIVPARDGLRHHVATAPGSTSTFRNGTVTMYTERLEGNLFGLIPIVFDPWHQPPLDLPVAHFTDVSVRQAGQFGGELTLPGMHQYTTRG